MWITDTLSDLDSVAQALGSLDSRRVGDIMNRAVLCCPADTTVREAAARMTARRCSSIVAADPAGAALGIWTEHDALSLDLCRPETLEKPLHAVMSSPVHTVDADMLLRDLVTLFNERRLRHYVVTRASAVVGVVTHTDLVRRQGFLQYLTLRTVDALVQGAPLTLPGTASLAEAAVAMRAAGQDAILVTGPDGTPDGILTGRDMVRLAAQGGGSGATCDDACSRPLVSVPRGLPLVEAHRMMQEHGIRHLAVTAENDHTVTALLSHRDILEGIETDYLRTLQGALRRQKAAVRAGEERQRQIIEASLQGYIEIDAELRIVQVNGALQRLLGRSAEELIGLTPDTLCTPETTETCRANLARVGDTPHRTYEVAFLHADGRAVPLHVAATTLYGRDGQVQGAFAFFTDLTEVRAAQARSAILLDKVSRSNAELEAFAYVVSHDLQEPLRMISSYLTLVERRYGEKLDDQGKEFIGFAVDGAKRLQSMIADLLDYSRVDRKGAPFAPTTLDEAVETAVCNLAVALEECGGTVEILTTPLPAVRADAMQMTRLFQNIIGNAIKYRAEDRPPRVRISVAQVPGSVSGSVPGSQGELWQVSIADNGMGLDERFAERIFLVFQRLHGRGNHPGNGIGLAVCKRIVERHGGRIWVESVPGEGSVFHFTLAADPEAAADSLAP